MGLERQTRPNAPRGAKGEFLSGNQVRRLAVVIAQDDPARRQGDLPSREGRHGAAAAQGMRGRVGVSAIRRSGKCGAEAWEHVVPLFAFAPSIRKAPLAISCAGYASTASSERIPNSLRYRVSGRRLAHRLVLHARLQSLATPRPCRNPSNGPSSRDRSKNQPYGDAALRIAQPAAGGTGWRSNSRQYRGRCPCIVPSC